MRRVVVTGNPGSGKSAFTRCLADLGAPTFSADAAVAQLYAPQGEAAQWIGRFGGAALLTPQGAVDKTALMEAMPVMDGLSATREIRRLQRKDAKQPLPVLALTAATLPDNITEIINAGMNDHIAKPFNIATLRTKLHRWLFRH